MTCRCHSSALYAGLVDCPRCAHRSFDPWCDACERRKCGYVKPGDEATPKPVGREPRRPRAYRRQPGELSVSAADLLGADPL